MTALLSPLQGNQPPALLPIKQRGKITYLYERLFEDTNWLCTCYFIAQGSRTEKLLFFSKQPYRGTGITQTTHMLNIQPTNSAKPPRSKHTAKRVSSPGSQEGRQTWGNLPLDYHSNTAILETALVAAAVYSKCRRCLIKTSLYLLHWNCLVKEQPHPGQKIKANCTREKSYYLSLVSQITEVRPLDKPNAFPFHSQAFIICNSYSI